MATLLEELQAALGDAYRVEREIASGGMGVVFLGRDRRLDRPVAIKVLRPDLAGTSAAARFLREARLLARLTHPNIVPVHHAGEAGGLPYYVMELVPGETLAERLTRGPLPRREVIALGVDLLYALEAAHAEGIVHRDVKPENVFLVPGRAMLADFGIARSPLVSEAALTSPGLAVGTLGYMAPEQMSGGEITPAVDIYAAGVLLLEAATGRRALAIAVGEHGRSGIGRRLERVLRRALAEAPGERWADARAFRQALVRAAAPRARLAWPAATLLLALVVAGERWWPRNGTMLAPPPEPEADLAIVPFQSADAAGVDGRLLARYAGTNMEWFPLWRVRPITYALAWWDTASAVSRESRVAQGLRVRYYVDGSIERAGDGLVLHLTVRDARGAAFQIVDVPGAPTDLLRWGRDAADSIARRVFPAQFASWQSFRTIGGSTNPQAVSEYLAGESAFRGDAYRLAEEHYERALADDPGFVLASWRLTIVRRWRRLPTTDELRRLAARADSLPPLYRDLVAAELEPDLPRRFARYRAVIGRYPEDADAILLYADDLFHLGPLVGVPMDSARVVMAEAARRSPFEDQAPAYDHIPWAYLIAGRDADAKRALDHRLRIAAAQQRVRGYGESLERAGFLRLAYLARFAPLEARAALAQRFWRPDEQLLNATRTYLRLGLSMDIPDMERRLGRIVVAHAESDEQRGTGYVAQGLGLIALGRATAAYASFDSAASALRTPESRLQAAEWRVLLPALVGRGAPSQAALGRAELRMLGADTARAARAAWALALDALAAGDEAGARRWAARVDSLADRDTSSVWLARFLDAVLQERRDPAAALAATDPLLAYPWLRLVRDPFARAALYLRRGEWLARRGDPGADAAWLWYENSDVAGWPQGSAQPGEIDEALASDARLRRARFAAARSRSADACAFARRVVELWSGADPDALVERDEAARLGRHCD